MPVDNLKIGRDRVRLLATYPAFRSLWAGQMLSQMGNAVFLIMGLWELQLRSPWLLAVAGLAMTVPNALAVVGGALVDRHDPRRLMLWTDFLRGGAVGLGLVALAVPGALPIVIIVLLGLNSLGASLFGPAEQVVLPGLVHDRDLPSANGVYSLTSQISGAVGSALGGAAVAAIGIRVVFGFDLGSFWFSALAIGLMMRLVPAHRPSPAEGSVPAGKGLRASLREGWRGLRELPWLVRLLPVVLVNNFAFAAAFTMLPYWSRHLLHTRALGFGLIDGAWAAGLLTGSLLVGRFEPWTMRTVIQGMSLVVGLSTLAFAGLRNPVAAGGVLLVAGIANGVMNANLFTLLQRLIPEAIRGRAFGLLISLLALVTPLGSLLAGLTLHWIPLWWSWTLGGLGGITLAALAGRILPRDVTAQQVAAPPLAITDR